MRFLVSFEDIFKVLNQENCSFKCSALLNKKLKHLVKWHLLSLAENVLTC